MNGKPWTLEDEKYLLKHFEQDKNYLPLEELAKKLGRSKRAVSKKAHNLRTFGIDIQRGRNTRNPDKHRELKGEINHWYFFSMKRSEYPKRGRDKTRRENAQARAETL